MTKASFEDYCAKIKAMAACGDRVRALNQEAVFAALDVAGVSRVNLAFDGSGDSGQIEAVTAQDASGETIELLAVTVAVLEARFGEEEPAAAAKPLPEAIEDLAYAWLEETHAGWEINDGAFGDFLFLTAERSVTLDYNERYTRYDNSIHVF